MKHRDSADADMYRRATRIGAWVSLVASVGVIVTGDIQGKIMTEVQPMKMAAAEALYETQTNAPFSIFTIGSLDGTSESSRIIEVPGLLSFLATGDFQGEVEGINDARAPRRPWLPRSPRSTAPRSARWPWTTPTPRIIPLTYWSFRLMMGLGFVSTFLSLMAALGHPQGAHTDRLVVEAGRHLEPPAPGLRDQLRLDLHRDRPPAVDRLRPDDHRDRCLAVKVSAAEVLISMVVYTLLYAALAVIEVKLFLDLRQEGRRPLRGPDARRAVGRGRSPAVRLLRKEN
jgi:cytochrome d ubiquinol oxidase subunit I